MSTTFVCLFSSVKVTGLFWRLFFRLLFGLVVVELVESIWKDDRRTFLLNFLLRSYWKRLSIPYFNYRYVMVCFWLDHNLALLWLYSLIHLPKRYGSWLHWFVSITNTLKCQTQVDYRFRVLGHPKTSAIFIACLRCYLSKQQRITDFR